MQEQKISTTHVLSSFSLARIELTEKLFDILIPVLNELHQTHYSNRFWKLMTKEYVNSVISKQAVLSSQLLSTRPETEPSNSFTLPTFRMRLRLQATRFVRFWRSRSNEKKIRQMLTSHHSLALSLPDLPEVKQELGQPLPTYYPYLWSIGGKKRKRVENMARQFEEVYTQNIIRQLPGFLVEHFDAMVDSIPLLQPEKKSFHVHNFHSLYNTLVVALYIEKGAKLYWYQHGAYYGELIGHNSHYFESTLSDKFRTWGWKIRDNDEPWVAYRLLYMLERQSKKYFTENRALKFDYALLLSNVAGGDYLQDELNQISIFCNRITTKGHSILIRPRPTSKIFSRKHIYIKFKKKNIVIGNGLNSILEDISGSRVAIITKIPSTSFFECILLNIPTLGLDYNDQKTDIVQPFYDFFHSVGVFHYSMESLCEFLSSTGNVADWWETVTKREEFHAYLEKFCSLSVRNRRPTL